MNRERSTLGTFLRTTAMLLMLGQLLGCEMDSFFNPSVVGYWEPQPTTIPILERLDAIEEEDDLWGQTTDVMPEDLIPSDLSYRMIPGDFVTIQVYELYVPGQWTANTRRIDAGGNLRVPELGDVGAAGLTAQEFEDQLANQLQSIIVHPQVDVQIEEGGGFFYTITGHIPGPGLYTLRNPDLRLASALAIAGGVPTTAEMIYIIRQVELTEDVKPLYEQQRPPITPEATGDSPGPVDIDDLIERLDEGEGDDISPGVLRQDEEPAIDIDDLEPVRVGEEPAIDIDELRNRQREAGTGGSWMYIEERGEWVRTAPEGVSINVAAAGMAGEAPLYLERIIEISPDRLEASPKYNIVVRPDDRIVVKSRPSGLVYIGGQISRPGTFSLPPTGVFTLSRAVTTAGGLNNIAIPERVDLVRIVGENREAVVRLNLAAIRHKTEPDIILKPDDHIIIGTSWVATPLAIIRNGFRATYGFGFLLDRNFGNDVFGAPPTNYVR